uniref:Armadillo repeat-containing protein 8 n=1 Tax=Panagrolaimus davidi TaxID=227884 RepID=A0A914QCV1_9BILA
MESQNINLEAPDDDEPPPCKRVKKMSDTALQEESETTRIAFISEVYTHCKTIKDLNNSDKYEALKRISDGITNNCDFPIEILFQNEIVPVLIQLIKEANNETRYHAGHILSYMTTGTSVQTEYVVSALELEFPSLMKKLESPNLMVQALEEVRNIMAVGPIFRDFFLKFGIIQKLLNINTTSPRLICAITEVLNHICQKPLPHFDITRPFVQNMLQYMDQEDENIHSNCIVILAKITDEGSNETKTFVLDNFVPYLKMLLDGPNQQIQTNVIYIFRNIISGNVDQLENVMKTGVISCLIKLLSEKFLLRPTLDALVSFMAHGPKACECCVNDGILEPLGSLTKAVHPDLLLTSVTLIRAFCQHYCTQLLPESAALIFRHLIALIYNSNEHEVLIHALYSISYFILNGIVKVFILENIFGRFIDLLNSNEINLRTAAFYAFGNLINSGYPYMKEEIIFKTVEMTELFLKHSDPVVQEKGLRFLSKAVKNKENIRRINFLNFIPECVKLLDSTIVRVQQLTVNLMGNFFAGAKKQIEVILQCDPHAILIRLLTSSSIDVRIEALGVIGHIIGFSVQERDKCIGLNITNYLLSLWKMKPSPNLINNFAKILFIIYQDPLPAEQEQQALFPCLLKLLHYSKDANIITNGLYAFSNVAMKIPDAFRIYVDKEVVIDLVKFLKHDNADVQNSALSAFENIAGNNDHKQHLVACGIFKQIKDLLQYPNKKLNAIGLMLLLKISNGRDREVQAIFDEENLLTSVINLLGHDDFELKKEAANIYSKLINGNLEQIMVIIKMGSLASYFAFMEQCDETTVIPYLEAFCTMCKKARPNVMEIQQFINDSDGKTFLSNMCKDVRHRAIIFQCLGALNLRLSGCSLIDL